jgi:pimeloyl-ACP methyl ester carboxylesterase
MTDSSGRPGATALLVHGAFHGAWCWDRLVPALTARGVECEAVELPFTSLADDAETVAAAIDQAAGPVVVVGHSYGGSVITAGAGGGDDRRPAAHLVYVAALMPDPEDPIELASTSGMGAFGADDSGMARVDPDQAVAAFYHRCPPADAEWAVSRLRTMPFATLAAAMEPGQVAWRQVPSTYVVCSDDQIISPDDQRRMAARAGRRVDLDADHSPFFCRVEQLSDVIADVTRHVGA